MHDPMMQRLGDMQTDLQNDLSALNDKFSQMSTSEQYQQLYDQQTQLQNNVNALNTASEISEIIFIITIQLQLHHRSSVPLLHSILLRRRLGMTRPFGI
jgi:hypothetical protein